MSGFHSASLADQVYEKLENDIIQGIYPRGEIITELKLVEQLGVSRTIGMSFQVVELLLLLIAFK